MFGRYNAYNIDCTCAFQHEVEVPPPLQLHAYQLDSLVVNKWS